MATTAFRCSMCGMEFDNKELLDRHNRTEHGMGGGTTGFRCSDCGMQFETQEQLQSHMVTHR